MGASAAKPDIIHFLRQMPSRAVLTEHDLVEICSEKERVEKHELDVRARLAARMQKMQEEAQK